MKKSYSQNDKSEKIRILGIDLSDISYRDILEYVNEIIKKDDKNYYFVTPNPEILVIANSSPKYRKLLNYADLALPDGIGVIWASKVLDKPIKHRNPGADLMESICRDVAKQPITVGFLGGGPGVAEEVANCLSKKYQGLKIGLIYQGKADRETLEYVKKLAESKNNNKKIDILFVAFGSPKQEIWIAENLKNLPARLTIGVGGAFDFVSGKVKRAPSFLRKIGLEWMFRLIYQPWRAKRQLALLKFIFLVLKERFNLNNV